MSILCVCGIDTGIGKSVATGLLARHLLEQGQSVITQKLVQTGCAGPPEDILLHRRLMESGWLEEDQLKLTCPYSFSFPASPHLAARLEDTVIVPDLITGATRQLAGSFDWVIVEGAGGLLVPLTDELCQLDYLVACGYPLILVTSSRLGSINHTLMSLEILKRRNLQPAGLIYNTFAGAPDEITRDSREVFSRSLQRHGFVDNILTLPPWPHPERLDWDGFLGSFPHPASASSI